MKLRWALCAFLLLQLAGCSSVYNVVKKTGQVIWDPSIEIGDPEERPATMTLSLVADDLLNPNLSGDSTPVAFQIFQLKDDSKFLAADYDSLFADPEAALAKNYIDHDDYALNPGQFKFIEAFELEEETLYIAVMAMYTDPEKAQWKKIEKLTGRNTDFHILVQLREFDVKLQRVE